MAVPVSGGGETGVLVAGKLLNDERDRVESAVRIAAGVSIVIMLLASLFIWLAAGRAVQPLRALARTTRTITETDLSDRGRQSAARARSPSSGGPSTGCWTGSSAFSSQKEFLADVGHELRTPITVIRGHLDTLGDDPTERREAATVINDELERMSRLVDDLLLLARSDRPDFLQVEPLDLDLLTHELFAKARILGVRRWLMDEADVGLVHADPHRLTSAVMNLAQNAVRHTRGDQAIAIGSSLDNGFGPALGPGRGRRDPAPRAGADLRAVRGGRPGRCRATEPASASRSSRRSPRPTAATSSWSPPLARGPDSRS